MSSAGKCMPNTYWKQKVHVIIRIFLEFILGYLTQVSDYDLASDTNQFVAFPPVRYTNSRCCVKITLFFLKEILVCPSEDLTKLF